MTATQRLELIQPGVCGETWADFGAGSGAFTTALLEALGPAGRVYAVDRDLRGLRSHPQVTPLRADFTVSLELPPLDGILLANSLHYVRGQTGFLHSLRRYLKADGRLIVVEYQDRRPSPWVPYPVSFGRLEALAEGYAVERIGETPSSFGGLVYAALLLPSETPPSVNPVWTGPHRL
ncbi:MAG: class I SAM-dependent methyltransferase [Meiothermus sp.]|nr:class I SAM-dependent methyltransferase [Meiothermus sp.]